MFYIIIKRSPSASERFYISLQPHFSVPVFCFLLQFVGINLGPNLNQIFLFVSFAFCCNLWDLNFIFPLLLFAAICSILDYTANYLKFLRARIVRKPFRASFYLPEVNKDWPVKKVTIFNTIVHLEKTSENILFFCLHFTWLCGWWNHQRILKK